VIQGSNYFSRFGDNIGNQHVQMGRAAGAVNSPVGGIGQALQDMVAEQRAERTTQQGYAHELAKMQMTNQNQTALQESLYAAKQGLADRDLFDTVAMPRNAIQTNPDQYSRVINGQTVYPQVKQTPYGRVLDWRNSKPLSIDDIIGNGMRGLSVPGIPSTGEDDENAPLTPDEIRAQELAGALRGI
jgi:hypothetical protein